MTMQNVKILGFRFQLFFIFNCHFDLYILNFSLSFLRFRSSIKIKIYQGEKNENVHIHRQYLENRHALNEVSQGQREHERLFHGRMSGVRSLQSFLEKSVIKCGVNRQIREEAQNSGFAQIAEIHAVGTVKPRFRILPRFKVPGVEVFVENSREVFRPPS